MDPRLEAFNKQQDDQKFNQPVPGAPANKQDASTIDEQRILNQVQMSGPPTPVAPTQGACPQCDLIHPPLQPGEKCPNAPLKIKGEEGQEINVNELVVKVKDILASQLEQKDVKDFKKFTGEMIVALMKFCEEYKE